MLISTQLLSQQSVIEFYGEAQSISRLNSQYDENFLSLSPDGSQLIFTRRNHPGNVGDRHNPGDLWISVFDSSWSIPRSSINIHPSKLVTPLGFVNDGQFFLYNTTTFDRGIFIGEIWISELSGEVLDNPKRLDIRSFVNLSEHQSGSISADGKHIVFSMEGNFTYGVEDLYVSSLRGDGSWSPPRNLGYRINTSFQEYTPFLAADNETLIFASNGRSDGLGSFDLYITQRADNTWQNWTEPQNLGSEVNSRGSETSFVFRSGDEYAYYVSTTNSDGYGDIKKIRIRSDIREVSREVQPFVLEEKEEDLPLIFRILDKTSNAVIDGLIKITGDTIEMQLESGQSVEFKLPDITAEASAGGYLTKVVQFTAAQLDEKDTFDISLDALTVGNTINLNNVLFHQGTANFIEGSEKELDRVVSMLSENPEVKIMIKGHTDNVGDPQLNLELSRERVNVVMDYIRSRGIKFNRLQGKGYGGNQPVAPNDTEENRRLNRRVEFTIIEN